MTQRPVLIVVTGATASGKTALAIELAERLGCEIVSADSRQIYSGLPIGTAAPTADELARVPHHLVGFLPLDAYYSAARYEADALDVLSRLWQRSPYAVMCGGSMMYVDAVTDGIDELPEISPEVRARVLRMLDDHGLEGVLAYLDLLDPAYGAEVDRANVRRVVHAVELCLQSGRRVSELRRAVRRERPFDIVKVAIDLDRPVLFDRINRRVDAMMSAGLLEEARRVYPLRHLNSLNTVGYKELFAYLDGKTDLDTAVARIAKNTRVYAKKQLTWLARPSVRRAVMLDPDVAVDRTLALLQTLEDF
ncbi:MAG: tRNA (adenosine(37)-N6)-dimethylallyltransferase MiaA [Bacteroidales bacterium]|nr:tRNA (adenosine(37)-N6)-dimethylallyltransferase MiaA [Bacteroidales bacterium]